MWFYENEEFSEVGPYVGFVYCITNLTNNKKYIGKKNFYFSKTKQVKGKKKKIKVESDWQQYYGSNQRIIEDVALFGESKFHREILHLCKTKAEMTYLELREQMDNRVLESDGWYNDWIMARIRKKHLTKMDRTL